MNRLVIALLSFAGHIPLSTLPLVMEFSDPMYLYYYFLVDRRRRLFDIGFHPGLDPSPWSSGEKRQAVRWRSWLSHLSNTQKAPGSSPGRIIFASLENATVSGHTEVTSA
jgi:hypothetical protein